MADDELSAPLGQKAKAKPRRFKLPIAHSARDRRALGLFVCLRRLGAGGQRPARRRARRDGGNRLGRPSRDARGGVGHPAQGPRSYDGPASGSIRSRRSAGQLQPPPPSRRPSTQHRHHHRRQHRQAAGGPDPGAQDGRAPLEQRLLETSRHGAIPRIAPDGARPAEAYARAATAAGQERRSAHRHRAHRARRQRQPSTRRRSSKLPGPVTFAFQPYGADVERTRGERARRRPRGAAAGPDGAVRLSRQRSGPADAADLARRPTRTSTACTG